jgi:hypothetical protein
MLMTPKTKITPADIRRFNLKAWYENRDIPAKEKSYFSQLMNGGASFGEKAARRLEQQYNMPAGYLDTHIPEEGVVKDHLADLLTGDPAKGIEAGLLKCFRGCKDEDRELLLSIANKLYERARPDDKTANPTRLNRRKTDPGYIAEENGSKSMRINTRARTKSTN